MKNLFSLTALSVAVAAASPAATAQTQTEMATMEEIVVRGQRAMMQGAIDRQRDADSIMNVITRDAIGQFPDQNVAEAVRRLPGINVLNDQGEGRFIAVRGLDPSLNAASINGTRIPAPESDTRSVALDVIPSELVESIEVIKTLTPDMDGDTIGASIQINTTSAFDAPAPFLSVKGEGSYNNLNEATSPKASIDFMYPFSDRFGVAGGLSFYDRETSTDNIESEGWDIDSGILYADTVEYRDYDVTRERIGGSLSFDFRASETTTLFARFLYSQFDDLELRRALIIELDEAPSNGTGSSAFFRSGDGEIAVEREVKDRFESQEITSYQIGGESVLGAWEIDYKATMSHAEEREFMTQDPTLFARSFEDPGELALVFDYSKFDRVSFYAQEGAGLFNDASEYEVDALEIVNGQAEDDELTFSLDIARSWDMESGVYTIKFGGKVRQREKRFDLLLEVLEDFDGEYTLADVPGEQSYGLADLGPIASLGAVRAFNAQNISRFELNAIDTTFESNVEDFEVDEDILAGYIMHRWETDRLMIVGGVRFEQTEDSMRSNLVELVEEGGTRDGVVLDDDTVFVTPNTFELDYTDVLPSLQMRYELTEDLVFRAGVFSSLVRPNIASLAPRFIVEENDEGEREGEFGNPDLEPYSAVNFDLSLEWYFDTNAVLQVGYFAKRLEDFIVNVQYEADDAPFNGVYRGIAFSEAVIPQNGDEADVSGFELAYQHALTGLPSPFDGLLVGLNYTFTDSEATIDGRTIPLPAASEVTYNAMLGYEKGPVSVRLTAAYRDEYLDELSSDPQEDRYVRDHLQFDLTAQIDVSDRVSVYGQIVNANNEPYIAFQRGPGADRLLQYEEYSWTGKVGVQVNF